MFYVSSVLLRAYHKVISTQMDNYAGAKVAFLNLLKMHFCKNPYISNDRPLPRKYTDTFVFSVSCLASEIFTLKIPWGNNNFYRRNNFPTEYLRTPCIICIFPIDNEHSESIALAITYMSSSGTPKFRKQL